MKGFAKKLREGYFAALSGVISVPVTDGRGKVSEDAFVIISDAIEGGNQNSFETWRTDVSIQLLICEKTTGAFTHDAVDGIEDEILQILIPSVDKAGFSVTGFQVMNVVKEASNYADEFGDNENCAKKILRIKQTLTQS